MNGTSWLCNIHRYHYDQYSLAFYCLLIDVEMRKYSDKNWMKIRLQWGKLSRENIFCNFHPQSKKDLSSILCNHKADFYSKLLALCSFFSSLFFLACGKIDNLILQSIMKTIAEYEKKSYENLPLSTEAKRRTVMKSLKRR